MIVPLFHVERFRNEEVVSNHARDQLQCFVDLIVRWNATINLVASFADIWRRHIYDCAQLLPYIAGERILDVGSGGGFPGMVLAILHPQLEWHFVEADMRKAVFLQEVRRQLRIHCTIHHQRVEDLKGLFDTITARAFAPLSSLVEVLFTKLTPTGRGVFLKGEKLSQEIKEADKKWRFTRTIFQSYTHFNGRIIVVRNVNLLS
jgi:16S rRNA (guanine527-N7)-methyltransferase